MPRFHSSAVLVGALAWLTACQPPAPTSERPNVLLVTIDTLRADHTSPYGYTPNTTPNLQRLSAEGARFQVAYAPMPTTAPSHASLFTSLHPATHGVDKNGLTLDASHQTLTQILAAAGYQTAAVVSSFALKGRFGLRRGFEIYQDDFAPESSTVRAREWEGHPVEEGFDRRADATTDRTLAWLHGARDASRPFFLFVHYFDPHDPFQPPEPFRSKHLGGFSGATKRERTLRAYDAEIEFTDRELGRLLQGLRDAELLDETLVIVTSDHGEGLHEHGYLFHGPYVYEEAVRVPLLMRWPERIAANRVIREPVDLLDVTPTILELLAVDANTSLQQGRSLAAVLTDGGALAADRPILLQRSRFNRTWMGDIPVAGEQFAIRTGPWKYIETSEQQAPQLYHLDRDPHELENAAAAHPDEVERLSSKLGDVRLEYSAASAPGAPTPEVSDEDRRRLEALGYLD